MTNQITTEKLIAERENTHGDFEHQTLITNDFKERMRQEQNWELLQPFQKEGLDMIMLKVGRILAGDFAALDHYDDIAGYAKLISITLTRLKPGSKLVELTNISK